VSDREEKNAEEERQREVLGALGRKYASFWLVLALLLALADLLYDPPAQFTATLFSGLGAWALAFVALPAYRAASALVRLSLEEGMPPSDALRFHRALAAGSLALAAYCAAAPWAGWPVLAPALLAPATSLFTCRALSPEDGGPQGP